MGSTILIDDWKDCVGAILLGFYPAMEGGTALAELIFGDVSPSGKLPFDYGMSYTTFSLSNPAFLTDGTSVTASCDICNIGK